MKDIFIHEYCELDNPDSYEFRIEGVSFPKLYEYYYRAKRHEIAELYAKARYFLRKAYSNDYSDQVEVEDCIKDCYGIWQKSIYYEAALFFYNSIVDISWVLVQVTLPYSDNTSDSGVKNILEINDSVQLTEADTAKTLLRKIETFVASPLKSQDYFEYISFLSSHNNDLKNLDHMKASVQP